MVAEALELLDRSLILLKLKDQNASSCQMAISSWILTCPPYQTKLAQITLNY
jgi:hypothetical protein